MKWFERLANWIKERDGMRTIYRIDDFGYANLYIRRFYIVKCKFFEIMLHQFYMSDRGGVHNHPWPSCGWILAHGYTEVTPNSMVNGEPIGEVKTTKKPGSFGYRGKNSWHRVELLPNGNGKTWTLFITGKRVDRPWGFWNKGFMTAGSVFEMDGTNKIQEKASNYKGFLFPRRINN